MREVLLPLVRLVETLSDGIAAYDEKMEKLGGEKYPHQAEEHVYIKKTS